MIGRCEAERKGESLLLPHGQFAFYDFYLDSIGVSEYLSLIMDDYVYTGGETRVTKTVAIFFTLFRIRYHRDIFRAARYKINHPINYC